MKTSQKMSSKKRLPRLIDAIDLKDLYEILKIRSDRYPTNFLDLLLLENKSKKLSEILKLYLSYKAKNRDFKTVSRIKAHISHRQKNDGWNFRHSGTNSDPIVTITGLKGKK
jgi:F0F1-type ATP synthase delta subunit